MIADPKGKIVGRHKATGFLVHREHQRTEKQLLDLRRRKAAMTPAERTKPWSTDETLVLVKAASADIGMIVLKEPLAIKKPLQLMSQDKLFAKYLENAFVQEGNMPLPLALALGRTVQTFIDQFPGATFVGVGLGAHKCPHTVIVDSWAEKGCAVDNLRRYAALSVKAPFAFPIGEAKGALLIVARSPKYDTLAPNLYGDSGAGLFIQPVGNDPILVGILNQGGKTAIGSPIIDTSGFIAHELGSGLVKRSNR
jgi:hypothetical protein